MQGRNRQKGEHIQPKHEPKQKMKPKQMKRVEPNGKQGS